MTARRRRVPRRLLAVLLLSLWPVAVLAGSGPAAAHTALIATDPAADARLSAGPARVSATFNEDLQPVFAAMTVVGPDGNLWSQGEAEVRGATVGIALRSLGPAGTYTVNYRVTSADGHPVSGAWSFAVTAAGAGTPGPPVTGQADRTPAPADPGPDHPKWLWPLLLGAAILLAGAAVRALRRRWHD